jgi:hypothetical protein
MSSQSFDAPFSITGQVLFKIFQKTLSETADLACEYIGEPVEGPSVMSLERSVRFAGPLQGLLVLRAHRNLGGMLLEKSNRGNGHTDSREAAFDYLARLFCERLIQTYGSLRDFEPLGTQMSNPQVWPIHAPFAGSAILVEKYPVEIRFWFGNEPQQKGEGI